MKLFVVLAVAVACASADVGSVEHDAPIVKSLYDIAPEGHFQYEYETANGISAGAQGVVENVNSEYPSLSVKGSFKYIAPDGTPVDTAYVADANGYQPSGSHLPVPPAIPELILRSLKYIADHPAPVVPEPYKKF